MTAPVPANLSPPNRMTRWVEPLTLLAGIVVLWFALPHTISGDGGVRYVALVNLVEHHRIDNIKCSYLVSILSLPLYFLGKWFGDPVAWCARFNLVVILLALSGGFALLRRRVDAALLTRFSILLLTASMLPNQFRNYYGEVLTVACVMLGALALACERGLLGWTLLVLGTVNAPAGGVGLALVATAHTWRTRRLRHLLPVLVAGLLIVAERYVQTGMLFVTGYEGDHSFKTVMPYSGQVGFSYPFLFGLVSILFSFGKGLLFFAPGLLLARSVLNESVDRGLRGAFRLWLWFLIGMVLVYSKWWAWYGGWCWGPRFFVLAGVPATLALAVQLSRNGDGLGRHILTLIILALSAWVGISGAVFDVQGLDFLQADTFAREVLTWYTPEFGVLGWPFARSAAGARPLVLGTRDWIVMVCSLAAVTIAAGPWLFDFARQCGKGVAGAFSSVRREPTWRL